ncbi:disintegrin and metalloproteinase domain-containing protein 15 isoform X2 [Brienomyrus brachyistius]|uniref:disintegrin and metalloproteinase domain-containing protein 15 isoform X2 n=1 Tax=Brienomyrus brachyistius TaxID=42636 RepID=UPI0020B3E786|nr:disintegrin and metalloproteinase domain-containing protein 15 isoform X2 [Brienomyrus brachyistius]
MATKTRKVRCCPCSGRVTHALYSLLLLESVLTVLVRGTTSQTTNLASDDAFGLLRSRDGGLSLSGGSLQKERRNAGVEDFHSKTVRPRTSHTTHRTGHGRGEPLEKTRPFVVMDGRRMHLSKALQNGHPDKIQCGLEFEGQTYLLDLEKNQGLLPKPPNMYYYLPNGVGVNAEDLPVVNCYYHGSVRGFPDSGVALSTCSGLRGVITISSNLSLDIRPAEVERGGAEVEDLHLLYPTQQAGSSPKGCGVSNDVVPPHMHRSKRDILSETKYIELVLVVDHTEYVNYQKNNKTMMYRMMDVANQVDWYYRPLNVRVALVGLEIWSDRDKIRVDKNPTETLQRFLEWRRRELLPRLRHDNAQLVMGSSFDGTTVGMASQSSMCSWDRSGGVNVDHLVSVLGIASTVAHELGHNLGMSHDTDERHCQCRNEPRMGGCIMEPSTGFMPGQLFSSCSVLDLSFSLLHGGGMCLFNVPQPSHLLGGPRCGNLYVEEGEECDCGLADECNDPCCDFSTCKLVPGAECSSDGICCDNCKLRTAGAVCRESLGECDLPEFCTGTAPHCPPNVFLQNGESCDGGASYCSSGVCSSVDTQCQALWGPNATQAPDVCFSTVNKLGNKFGNCGQLSNGSYVPCVPADVRCGRIQCQGGNSRPLLGSSTEILTTTVHFNHTNIVCRGASFDLGNDVSDPAMVAEGTACGPGKICMGHLCKDVSMLGVETCRQKCNGHGVCNSNNNCHCDMGWEPPDCKYSGNGGSVESGPAQEPRVSSPARVALLVIFLFILPVLLLFLALRLGWCRRRRACQGSSFWHKGPGRQQTRTPATERSDTRNTEQLQPLRYHWPNQVDIPMTQPSNKLTVERPAPPNKPLPPDPVLTGSQTRAPEKPPPPKKAFSAETCSQPPAGVPGAFPTAAGPSQQADGVSSGPTYAPRVAVVPARRPPPPPTRTSQPIKSHSPPPV